MPNVPANIEVPFVYIAIDNTGSVEGLTGQTYRVLLIGSASAGTAEATKVSQITAPTLAKGLFGAGSDLTMMAESFFKNDNLTQLYGVSINPTGLTQASCTLQIGFAQGSAAIGAPGSLRITVDDTTFSVNYTPRDTLATIEKAIKSTLPLVVPYISTDAVDEGSLTLTAIPKGEIGNFFFSCEDTNRAESKLTITISGLSAEGKTTNGTAIGAANYNGIFDNLPDVQYNIIVASFTTLDFASRLRSELADRFGPLRQKDGYSILTVAKTSANIPPELKKLNSPFITILNPGDSLTPPYLFGAATAGQITGSASIDPARPFQTLELQGRFAPPKTKPTFAERNSLLLDGISTIAFDQSDRPRIERIVTTYKTNAAGADDRSYHDLNTLLTLSFIRNDFRSFLLTRYGRSKVANDGSKFAAGVQVITPKLAKAETIGRFREYEFQGLVENVDALKQSLIVRRSPTDPNRLDFLIRPNLVNPLTVIGVDLGFIL